MASTLKLNTLQRAQIVQNSDGSTVILRTGFIKGIDTNGASNDEIMAEAMGTAGMPAMLSAHPGTRYAAAKLRQVILDAFPQNNKKLNVTLRYEAKVTDPAAPPVVFVLSRRTTMVETLTELHPNGLVPMVTVWRNPANPTKDVVRRTCRVRMFEPFQRLVASGYYRNGPPPDAMIAALGSVNEAPWRGYPAGYWLYADQSDVTQDSGGSYNITVELWNRMTQDWSSWDILRDHNGRNLTIDPSQVDALKNTPYMYGMLDQNGIKKIGLYRTEDYASIFGFGGIA